MKNTLTALIFSLLFNAPIAFSSENTIKWQQWNADTFAQAKKENKLILVDLVAVWCHWCHVMEEKTYADPSVVNFINEHYIAVKADHDERPDLAERYRDWGWPATIIINGDGVDIVKRAGYIAKDNMLRLLKTVLNDRSPEFKDENNVVYNQTTTLSTTLKNQLQQNHNDAYDTVNGSFKSNMKYLDPDSILWSLYLSKKGSVKEQRRVNHTLTAGLKLIDPAFGGVYQYSTYGDWLHPHYEKIMKTQARYLVLYSKAYSQFNNPAYLQAAKQTAHYLKTFLTDANGGFYTSQDADLIQGKKAHNYFKLSKTERLKQGIPKVDKNQYTYHNALAIEGLAELAIATKDEQFLNQATDAANWIIKNRRLWAGGYRHNKYDASGPYLGDTLQASRAFLALYKVSNNPYWLQKAVKGTDFISQYFKHEPAGLKVSVASAGPIKFLPKLDQNISAALFLLDLKKYSFKKQHQDLLNHTLKYLTTEKIATSRISESGILLVNELNRQNQ